MLNLKNTLDGYLKNVEVVGNTIQNTNNLADIRSVGDKVDGQELYKIDVVSCGKNLFDKTKCIKGVIGANGVISTNNEWNVSEFIKVRPDMQLVKTTFADMCAFDINKNPIGIIANGTTMFTIPANCYYIRCNVNNVSLDTYQLEEGTVATPYEPYQEQKLEILSPVQLEKVGDVADRIICKDGVWGIEKNIKTIVLDGSESWSGNGESNISMRFSMVRDKNVNYDLVPRLDVILSDMYVKRNVDWNSDIEGIENGAHDLSIRLSRTRLSTHDVAGFKEWLKTNNTLVKYQTRTSQFISLPHDQQVKLRTFAGQTNIAFLTEIAGQIKAQVPKSLGAVVNTHTEQIADLHNSLERVKKLEETTVSTIETGSNFTTVDATNNGYFEDVKLEGKTLVNLNKYLENNKVLNIKGNGHYNDISICDLSQIKLNTTYTMLLDIEMLENNSSWELGVNTRIAFGQSDVKNTLIAHPRQMTIANNGGAIHENYSDKVYQNNVITFNIKELNASGSNYLSIRPIMNTQLGQGESIQYKVKNLIILEGDHTNNPPEYFEGLMSVGQDVEEVSVKSVNGSGNLFGFESKKFSCNATSDWYDVQGVPNMYSDMTNKTNCKVYLPAGTYTFGYDGINSINVGAFQIVSIDEKIVVNANSNENFQKTYYLSEGVYTIRAKGVSVGDVFIKDVYILKGDVSKPYTPHQSNKKPLLYFNPTTETWEKPILREWDTIEKHSDGKYYYHKRSGEVVLNGSEGWVLDKSFDNTCGFYLQNFGITTNYVICKDFKYSTQSDFGSKDEECVSCNNNAIKLRVLRSKLTTQDVEGFKAWLKANPTTVVYQLAQEEIYECTNIDLMTYSGETNYIINSGAISPKSLLKVHNNISNVVKILQEKVSLLENTFIAGLKSVLSGDMYSLATILYPEDFEQNDNTEQDIMVIPE